MRRVAAGCLLIGALLTGCGLEDPYADQERQPRPERTDVSAKPADAGPADTHATDELERASPPEPPTAPAGGGARSAAEAASLYTLAFTNWTWRDVADRSVRVLARLAGGDLRSLVLANAQELRDDTTLRRDRAANRGTLVALDEQGSDPERRTVWVVMRETASTAGLTSAAEKSLTVYRLTVERLRKTRWYVTEFEPQA
jgi:hypothetical protein